MAIPCIEALQMSSPSCRGTSLAQVYITLTMCTSRSSSTTTCNYFAQASFGAAWRYRHYAERIGIAHNHRSGYNAPVLPEHRIEGYNRSHLHGAQPEAILKCHFKRYRDPLMSFLLWAPHPPKPYSTNLFVRWPKPQTHESLAVRARGHLGTLSLTFRPFPANVTWRRQPRPQPRDDRTRQRPQSSCTAARYAAGHPSTCTLMFMIQPTPPKRDLDTAPLFYRPHYPAMLFEKLSQGHPLPRAPHRENFGFAKMNTVVIRLFPW